MKRLSIDAQSIIEYLIILMVVAIVSMAFARNFLYDENGNFKLFIGYVVNAKGAMGQ